MRMLERGGQALWHEARLALAALRDRRLALSLACFALLLVLVAQAPLRYQVNVGQADGPGSDLPIVTDFYPPEQNALGDYRWTMDRSRIWLPGVGQRPLQVMLKVFPINEEVAQRGPREIEVWVAGQLFARLPVRPSGAVYRFILPRPDTAGNQAIELRSTTVLPTGDARAIGTPVDALSFVSGGGPVVPALPSTLAWLGAALLAWLALRRTGFSAAAAQLILAPALLLAALAALLDPLRFAFGGGPVLVALAFSWLLALVFNAEVPALLLAGLLLAASVGGLRLVGFEIGDRAVLAAPLLLLGAGLRPSLAALQRRLEAPITLAVWRWLVLIALLVFAMRYGGKIYPESMPGDIGFHSNRLGDVERGLVLLLSLNRGVYFPYPPALYLLLAPFSLLGVERSVILHLAGALLDALSPFLIYLIATKALCCPAGQRAGCDSRFGVLAAGIYSFSAAGFMTTWWNFSTHIFAQFTHLLLITALVLVWPLLSDLLIDTNRRPHNEHRRSKITNRTLLWALFLLQSLVYLGHFGFWINMSLLGAIGLATLLLAAWRGYVRWTLFRSLLLSFIAAQVFAALFFYSGYTELFLAQIRATASGGLTGLAGRAPVDRAILWRNLWDSGFRVHFGFFPLPLALCGLALFWRRMRAERSLTSTHCTQRIPLLVLMAGTFMIALFFAALPFLSGSTLSTRWLMFSAWAIAVGAAVAVELLWRSGRAGRILVIATGGYVVWVTVSMWLAALAWRVRPPEPF